VLLVAPSLLSGAAGLAMAMPVLLRQLAAWKLAAAARGSVAR